MAGTKNGGMRAAATNKQRYGHEFYRQIGRKGGLLSKGGGFTNHDLAREAGRKGGKASRRIKSILYDIMMISLVGGEPMIGPKDYTMTRIRKDYLKKLAYIARHFRRSRMKQLETWIDEYYDKLSQHNEQK